MVVNWGVIGCGTVATNRTIPEGITQASNARLVAVADVVGERAVAVGNTYGVRSYTGADDLLRDPDVDAVYVSVPPFAHAAVASAAARYGKATLLEKPIALNATEGEGIVASHRAAGTTLGIGFMMRYHACHAQLKAMLQAGDIGDITAIRARYSVWYPPDPDRPDESWLFDPARAGGGPLMDAGCHALDLMVHVAGRVDQLAAFSDTLVQGCEVEDTCSILLRFASGAQGVLQVYNCTPNFEGRNVLEVHGSRGTLVAQSTFTQLPTGTLLHFAKNGHDGRQEAQPRAVTVQPVNTYRTEIERFSDSVRSGEPYWIGGEQGVYVQRLVDAAYRSAREGMVLDVSEGYPPVPNRTGRAAGVVVQGA